MANLKIMSNNIWCMGSNSPEWEAIGEDCSAQHRAKGFVKTYMETKPDVIGMQECTITLADFIMQEFKKKCDIPYALLWGRDTPIIYRADKFEVIDVDYLIYPEEVPGYEGEFNNSKTKSYCVSVLKTKEDGKLLIFATTHLWYKWSSGDHPATHLQPHSDEARTYQLNLLMDRVDKFIEKYNCPAIIVGDFNAPYSDDVIQSAFDRGYEHCHDIATGYKDEKDGYHLCDRTGFDRNENPLTFFEAIDHILIKNKGNCEIKSFNRFYGDYYMCLSDHFPAWCDIEL